MRILPLVLVVAAGVVSAQEPSAPPQTFRSRLDVLTVEASVRDAAGKPITDLQPSDFTVRIDGQPRKVLTSRLYGHDSSTTPLASSPIAGPVSNVDRPSGRAVVFAIDRDSIRPGGERALLETAAKMLDQLSPEDAAAAAALPGAITDLTRDRAVVAAALRTMTGTQPPSEYLHYITWPEALGYDHKDSSIIQAVVSRECSEPQICPGELRIQARSMVLTGRLHAQSILAQIDSVVDRLGSIAAPKHLVLISAGIPFDEELIGRYRDLADKAARGHVALFVVQMDQSPFDASAGGRGAGAQVYGGRDNAEGLGNIASITGGQYYNSAGKAGGIFDRIASDINYFYQLGVESHPSDVDGKVHRVEINVSRPGLSVRAPSETATPPVSTKTPAERLKKALAEPIDVAELPLEVATYMTHSKDPDKVRVLVAPGTPDPAQPPPDAWGSVLLDASNKIVAAVGGADESHASVPWATTGTLEVPPGKYRLRTVIVSGDRVGTLELPVTIGMRAAGDARASDLIVGVRDGGMQPRGHVMPADHVAAVLEISSPTPLADVGGTVLLTPAGGTQPVLRAPLAFGTRADDTSIVLAEADLNVAAIPAGIYTASAILEHAGQPVARISRRIEVKDGPRALAVTPAAAPAAAPATPRTASPVSGDPAVNDVMQRVGSYVAGYGEQASVIIGVEHYLQVASAGDKAPVRQKTVAEFALVKTSDSAGWAGFRDVVEVDGRAVSQRADRLKSVFTGSADVAEARKIADESSRYNLGGSRNFNEPTAALFFFLPGSLSRFTFTHKRDATVAGVNVWEIEFKETATPTLIKTTDGKDVPAHGTLWVVPDSGTVVRTVLAVKGFAGLSSSSTIDVGYTRDDHLQVWLPATMSDRHETEREVQRSAGGGRRVSSTVTVQQQIVVAGTATYSDFKRFETSATIRIK